MKLIHLFESELPVKLADVIELIKKDCQPFLSKIGADPLFRGSSDLNPKQILHKGSVRMDRKPTDTSADISKLVDEMLEPIAGFKPRSQSLFCTGNRSQASGYGEAFLIFPIGDFKFLWSEYIKDFYTDVIKGVSHSIKPIMYEIVVKNLKSLYGVEDVTTIPFIKEDEKLLNSMMDGDSSYVFAKLEPGIQKDIIKEFLNYTDWYQTDNLSQAILKRGEIMIHCKEYYAVSYKELSRHGTNYIAFMSELQR